MLTQISFTTNTALKERAANKAKKHGITMKALLTFAMEAFVNDKIKLGITNVAEFEELQFNNKKINENAAKLVKILK